MTIKSVYLGDDDFYDMPLSAQALFFHLVRDTDYDSVCYRPRAIARMIGASEEDINILKAHNFIQFVQCDNGLGEAVIVGKGGVLDD